MISNFARNKNFLLVKMIPPCKDNIHWKAFTLYSLTVGGQKVGRNPKMLLVQFNRIVFDL